MLNGCERWYVTKMGYGMWDERGGRKTLPPAPARLVGRRIYPL